MVAVIIFLLSVFVVGACLARARELDELASGDDGRSRLDRLDGV